MANLQKNLINNMLYRIIQQEKNYKFRALHKCMRLLGFAPDQVRRALFSASGIRMEDLADDEVSLSVLYGAYNGYRNKGKKAELAMNRMAAYFETDKAEFWEDVIGDQAA